MKKFNKISIIVALVVVFMFGLVGLSKVNAATAVSLGSADNFAVLAGSFITAATPSTVVGDVGLSPASGTFYTGLTTGQVTGTIYATDVSGPAGISGNNPGLLTTAKASLDTAYGVAAGAGSPIAVTASSTNSFGVGTINNGANLSPGVYNSASTMGVTGTLTLDGGGDPNAVFIFQAGSSLTTATGAVINLIGSAQACNVFWQVGSSATLGTNTTFKGNILAFSSITDNGGAVVNGRFLARGAAVTLNNTSITKATCSTAGSGGTRQGSINVLKVVINDSGGNKVATDFPLFVNGTRVANGASNDFSALVPDMYVVTEISNSNYVRTFSGDCDINGHVSLNPGDSKYCIITNNDIGAPSSAIVPPLIDIVKIPSPLALPAGPGVVSYTYSLHNIGTIPVSNITVVDDSCAPMVFVSGDTNSNNKLDLNETWVNRCSTMLSKTHTNNVVATGTANGLTATDIASATVVVGVPIVPPLIHVTKIPSPLALSVGGGLVTYTEKISNPGVVTLSNINIVDDKCRPLRYVSGDVNMNSKLESNEVWTYVCQSRLTSTTTNTVVVSGEANGITVRDFAIATVVVASPSLPNTGFAPNEDNYIKNVILMVSSVIMLSVVLVLKRRKQNVE